MRERERPKTITKPKITTTMYHMHSRFEIHCSGGCFRFVDGFGYNHHMHTFVASTCMHVVHSGGDGFEYTYLEL
jgi:hypothetical protein